MLSLFASDKAPIIISLFVAMFAWFANKAVSDSEGLLLIGYAISGSGSSKTVTIRNLSIKRTLQNAVFVIACADSAPCMENKDGGYAAIRLHSPYGLLAPSFGASDASVVQLNLSIPAGGEVDILPHLTRDAELRFFLGNVATYEQIRFVDDGSVVAFLFAHYYNVLLSILAILMLMFAVSVVALTRAKLAAAGADDDKEKTEPPPAKPASRGRRKTSPKGGT